MNNVPNLDAMEPDDLMKFWYRHNCKSRARARALFGEQFSGYINAMRDLANYASNKATAMQCRLRGDVQGALMYEGICERIYSELPPLARW